MARANFLIEFWNRRGRNKRLAQQLFDHAVQQSRKPQFFRDFTVPDTPQGRFEILALHLFMLQRGLQICAQHRTIGRVLANITTRNLDDNLREMGVSDVRMGDRMKAMTRDLYGRFRAYDAATPDADTADLAIWQAALARNIYRTQDETQAAPLAAYCVAVWPLFMTHLPMVLAGNRRENVFGGHHG
ncbi:MAG: ubiquinol-cytochrome C chaperone family protein [Pseudomonadota bacterium]